MLQRMQSIDLNCDCGESFGVYQMGDDAAMLGIVTSANVACGFHGGDPEVMASTFRIAKENGVAVGAHPGFPDLWGFGRRRLPFSTGEIERLVAYQIGAAQALAAYAGHKITHVKPHGALSNVAMEDRDVARAIARAVRAVDSDLAFLAVARSALEQAGAAERLNVVSEIFADRAYTERGLLLPRTQDGAVLHDPERGCRARARHGHGRRLDHHLRPTHSGSHPFRLRAWRHAECGRDGQGGAGEARSCGHCAEGFCGGVNANPLPVGEGAAGGGG